ncbi:phage terminase large subunit [Sulfitobacter sediminilitoris]|uniref:phage terminase large subunit n=1 Tax=Sulfitobacter sediminilitoris TaxID=2698830 RepID=UPI00361EF846
MFRKGRKQHRNNVQLGKFGRHRSNLWTYPGVNIRGIIPKGDKQTRLLGVTPLIESGKVAIPKNAPWLATFQHEVILFPKGKHDDQVDSLSQFLIWLGEPVATAMSGTVI